MHHALLACSAFAAERAAMWAAVEQVVGRPTVSAAQALPAGQQLAALLGDSFWGSRAEAVDGAVQQYLAAQIMRRRRASVPAAAAALGGAAGNPADVACQACNKRSGAATSYAAVQSLRPGVPHARAAWCQQCLVCLMVIGSAPAVLLPRHRQLPPSPLTPASTWRRPLTAAYCYCYSNLLQYSSAQGSAIAGHESLGLSQAPDQ
jgi:hypothetical protein